MYDIIGDLHGCSDELQALLLALGYSAESGVYRHPTRTAIFLGDYVDRGPDSAGVLWLVRRMCAAGAALGVLGNHDDKLRRYLDGHHVRLNHGLAGTVEQIEAGSVIERSAIHSFLAALPAYLVLDEGRLIVAHAGLRRRYIGRHDERVRRFTLYGEVTGESDLLGFPIRLATWTGDYATADAPLVVYGHTPQVGPLWQHNTVCIDLGCVFGGRLACLRYPERTVVTVPALHEYAPPAGRAVARGEDVA